MTIHQLMVASMDNTHQLYFRKKNRISKTIILLGQKVDRISNYLNPTPPETTINIAAKSAHEKVIDSFFFSQPS